MDGQSKTGREDPEEDWWGRNDKSGKQQLPETGKSVPIPFYQ